MLSLLLYVLSLSLHFFFSLPPPGAPPIIIFFIISPVVNVITIVLCVAYWHVD